MEQDIHFSKKDVKTEEKKQFVLDLIFSAYVRSITFGRLSIGIMCCVEQIKTSINTFRDLFVHLRLRFRYVAIPHS